MAWPLHEEALKRHPHCPDLLLEAGACRLEMGDAADALTYFDQAKASLSDRETRHFVGKRTHRTVGSLGRGTALIQLSRVPEAIAELQRGVEWEPEDKGDVHGQLAHAYALRDRWEEALAAYHEAFRREPAQPRWTIGLVDALGALGRHQDAQGLAATLPPSDLATWLRARSLLAGGQASEAVTLLRRAGHDKQALDGTADFGVCWRCAGETQVPRGAAGRKAAAEEPGKATIRSAAALLWFGLGEAEPDADIDVTPVHEGLLGTWVRWLIANERFDDVQRLSERWPQLGPQAWPQLRWVLAREMARGGFEDVALPWMLEVHRADPANGGPLYWLGRAALANQHQADARGLWERALAVEPGIIRVTVALGKLVNAVPPQTPAGRERRC